MPNGGSSVKCGIGGRLVTRSVSHCIGGRFRAIPANGSSLTDPDYLADPRPLLLWSSKRTYAPQATVHLRAQTIPHRDIPFPRCPVQRGLPASPVAGVRSPVRTLTLSGPSVKKRAPVKGLCVIRQGERITRSSVYSYSRRSGPVSSTNFSVSALIALLRLIREKQHLTTWTTAAVTARAISALRNSSEVSIICPHDRPTEHVLIPVSEGASQ